MTEQLSHHIFFGLFHSPSVECSTANCDFGALTGGDKCLSFYSAILENDDLDSGTLNRGASPVVQTVKNLPAMQESWVRSLGWEDPLEKGTATHSSILAWRIP